MKVKLEKKRTQTLSYFILKVLSFILCLLPYFVVLYLGKILGYLAFLLLKKQRERAINQVMTILAFSKNKATKIVQKLFLNLTMSLLEVFYLPAMSLEKMQKTVVIENEEILKKAYDEGKGVIALTGHFGNWEWLGAALAIRGYKVVSLVKEQNSSSFMKFLEEIRANVGIKAISTGSMEMVAAVKALKQGMIMGFFHDKDAGVYGTAMEFLGKMSSTPLGAAVFAKKFKTTVVPLFIKRKTNGTHKIIVQPSFKFSETDDDQDISLYNFTKKLNSIIEDMIYKYPEEWLWTQKRWNTPCEDGIVERLMPVKREIKRQKIGKVVKEK